MKALKYLFLGMIAISGSWGHSFAQKALKEVTLSYKISIESTNEKPASSKLLDGAVLTQLIGENQSRADMVSTLGTETNLFDNRSGKGYILKEYSGQKLMITLTRENWEEKNRYFQNMKFNIDNEEQQINGFRCKKATAVLEDGKSFVVYYATEYNTVNKGYFNAFKNLPGIPVQYELESRKLKFKYTLTGISYDNISEVKFDVPRAGFRVMTYEENQQLKKG